MDLNHMQILSDDVEGIYSLLSKVPNLWVSEPVDGYFEVRSDSFTISVFQVDSFQSTSKYTNTPIKLGGIVLQFSVDDVEDSLHYLQSTCTDITDTTTPVYTPWGTRSVYITHSSGLIVELYSWN